MGFKPGDATGVEAGEQRLALLICNGEFPLKPSWNLPGVAQDAQKIRGVLAHPDLCGFDVTSVLDGGLVEVRREVARLCARAQENDTVLIYYSGNGTLDEAQRLQLLVADTDPEHYHATSLEPEFILDQLRMAGCRRVVLVVDTCHAGAFFNGNRGIPDGLYAVTSCRANQIANDTREGGAFSLATIQGLLGAAADSDGDGRVTIEELHDYVHERLTKEYTGRQTPQKWIWNIPGPIYMTTAQNPVFLSYSRTDSDTALELKRRLEEDGFTIWMDIEDVRSGAWKERIFEGIGNARAFVFLMTESSLGSEFARKEIDLARRKNVPVIPVQIGEIGDLELPDWFEFDYGRLQRYFLDPQNPAPTVANVAKAVRDACRRARGERTVAEDADES